MKRPLKNVQRALSGAVYSRVSDDESAAKEHGSLENQNFIGTQIADALTLRSGIKHSIEYVLTEEDGRTGSNTNRPQYQRLLQLIKFRKIDFIVAKDISRLNRSVKDFSELVGLCKENSVSVHITGLDLDFKNSFGEMLCKLLALLAEFEHSMITDRTRKGIRAAMMNRGRIHGGRMILGFDRDKDTNSGWKPNHEELKQCDRLLHIVTRHDSFTTICDALKREGISNKQGNAFDAESLKRLVRSKRYEGILVIHDEDGEVLEERPLDFGPVLDKEKLALARAKITEIEDKFSTKTRASNRNNLLTGLLEYKDGTSFRGTSGTSANGEKSYYYINDRHKISIGAEKLEKAVIDSLTCFKDDEEVQGYAKEAIQQMASGFEIIDDQIRALRNSLGEIRKRELGLVDALSTGAKIENVSAWLQEQLGTIKDERTEVERSIERLEREKAAIEAHSPSARNMKKTLSYVFEHFDKAEPSVQRNFIRQVFDKIVVSEKNVIKLFWRFADCDAGGEKFALGREWGE